MLHSLLLKSSATASRTKSHKNNHLAARLQKPVGISECCNAGDPSGRASPAERAKRLRYNDMKGAALFGRAIASMGFVSQLVRRDAVSWSRGAGQGGRSLLQD